MKVAINNQDHSNVDIERGILREAFPDVEVVESRAIEPDELIAEIAGVRGALIQYGRVTAAVVDALPECIGYVRYGVGYDHMDAAYAWSVGKKVAYTPYYCTDEVSNHAASMILALHRALFGCDRLLRENAWHVDKIRPRLRLVDCTLGIVGLGNIGKRTADKMKAFFKRILFYDPYVDGHPGCEKLDDLVALAAQSDTITLHPLLNNETRHLIDGGVLAAIKPTAFLVNTSRGAVIDQEALIARLREKEIAGAALDVFETEPIPADSPLRDMDNVILTHHTAWYSEGAIVEVKEIVARQMVQILRGEMPEYPAY